MDTNKQRAADFASQALAWLDERTVPPTPDNFKLAYAYVEGENAELKRGFDALMAVGSKFDAGTMRLRTNAISRRARTTNSWPSSARRSPPK